MDLPPGQHAIDDFPRFGTHMHHPPPPVPGDPVIEIGGAVAEPLTFRLAELATLPRREITADFHCVSGWSATGLRWEGVPFATFYRTVVEPVVAPAAPITHLVFGALDGFEAALTVEDAMGDDVLIADRLDGRPLDGDHGAPVRLVSPSQYGYHSTKHLCRIELRTSAPQQPLGSATGFSGVFLRALALRHPRGRVWHEERHPHVPARVLRHVYRPLVAPIRMLSARGSRRSGS